MFVSFPGPLEMDQEISQLQSAQSIGPNNILWSLMVTQDHELDTQDLK